MKPILGFALIALTLGAASYLYVTLSPHLEAYSTGPSAIENVGR